MAVDLAKIPMAWRVGALLSLVAATLVAENVYAFQAESADEAAAMLRNGVQTTADALHASDTVTIAVGFGFTRAYRVHYRFSDGQGRVWTGGGHVTAAEFAALSEPSQPETMRRDAHVTILYDLADPARNGIRSAYEREAGPRLWLVISSFITVLMTGLALTWRAAAAVRERQSIRRAAAPRSIEDS